MENKLVKADEFGLEENQVQNVDLAFSDKVKERELLSEVYSQIIKKDITKEVAQEARDVRLKAVKIKSGIAAIHKSQKEFALAFGKYCDAWKRKETEPIQQMIDGLIEIEKHEELKEKQRIDALQSERVKEVSKYLKDAEERDLASMDNDVWIAFYQAKKKAYEDEQAAIKKAEEDRLAKEKAEAEERKRIKEENEKLRKEAEEKERLSKIEAEKRAKIEYERIAKEKAEQEKRELKAKAERDKHEAELKAERDKQAKLKRELEAKEKAEKEAKEEEERKRQAELKKGDIDKIKDLIKDLESIKSKYSFESSEAKKMYSDVGTLIDKTINHIKK